MSQIYDDIVDLIDDNTFLREDGKVVRFADNDEVKLYRHIMNGVPGMDFTEMSLEKAQCDEYRDEQFFPFLDFLVFYPTSEDYLCCGYMRRRKEGTTEYIPLCMVEYYLRNKWKSAANIIIKRMAQLIMSIMSAHFDSCYFEDIEHPHRCVVSFFFITHVVLIVCDPSTNKVIISLHTDNESDYCCWKVDAIATTILSLEAKHVLSSLTYSAPSLQCLAQRAIFRNLKTKKQWDRLKNLLPGHITREFPDDDTLSRILYRPDVNRLSHIFEEPNLRYLSYHRDYFF